MPPAERGVPGGPREAAAGSRALAADRSIEPMAAAGGILSVDVPFSLLQGQVRNENEARELAALDVAALREAGGCSTRSSSARTTPACARRRTRCARRGPTPSSTRPPSSSIRRAPP